MKIREIARKSMLGILIILLTAQGWLTGWNGEQSRSYAANELSALGIKDTVPAVKAMNVDSSAPLMIDFEKPVKKADSTESMIIVKRLNDNTVVDFVPVSSGQVAIDPQLPINNPPTPGGGAGTGTSTTPVSGYRVNITLNKVLPGATYYVEIDNTSFVYSDDNTVFKGLTNKEWTFSTQGLGSTTMVSKVPENATIMKPSTNIVMTFNKPVTAGQGTMIIYQDRVGGTVFEQIPIDAGAPRVAGLGTSTITIDPAKDWNSNTTYYVVMPEGYLRDMNQNDISGISGNVWGFNIISDPTALTVSSLSPANGTTNASVSGSLSVTFSKELDPAYFKEPVLKKSNGTIVSTRTSFSANSRQLTITPTSELESNMEYIVDLPANAYRDRDGNVFTGLNGSTSWKFRTISKDTTAPVLKNAKMHSNNTIRLTYDKWLSSINPHSSTYAVTVNGEKRNVSYTYISGDSVYVVLDTGVAVGQIVRIGYTPGTSNRVTDQSNNAAAPFGARDVDNGLDSVMSKPREGNVYYSTITLYYPETVYVASSEAISQFNVTADEASVGVSSISANSSSVVTLNLSRSITDGEVVRVSYTPGSWPVKDSRGQALAGFSGFYVRNTIDTKPPEFKSAEVSGNKLWMQYNEPLHSSNKPQNSQYSVLVDGKPVFVTQSEIDDNLVTLTLASAVRDTQNVTLSYVPGTLRLTDLNSNPAGYLNMTPVAYTYGNGKILSAVIQGDTIQIQFREAIQPETALTLAQFSVMLSNGNTRLLSASASGSVVTLKLDQSLSMGMGNVSPTGTISYTPGPVPIRDASNTVVPAFGPLTLQQTNTSLPVNNQTGGRPSWLNELDASNYGYSLLVMNNSTASSASAVSHYNRSTRQFNVDGAKLRQAFEYASTSGKLNQPVVFEVPASEPSAYVGFPLTALTEVAANYRSGTIGVRYGDRLWTVELFKLDLASMSRNVGAFANSTGLTPMNESNLSQAIVPSLYVQLETVPLSDSGTMEGLIARAGAQKLANYTNVYVFASKGPSEQQIEQQLKSELSMQVSANTPRETSSMVSQDLTTFQLSYVPSSFKSTPGGVIIQGRLNGNQSVVPLTHGVSYQDTASHWANDVIKELSAKWIIGTPNGSYYRPDENISRAEFAELVARGLGLKAETQAVSRFRDVRGGSITSAYIAAAAEAGIITGNTDGTFKPDRAITREQMAIMMIRAMNYGGQTLSLQSSANTTLSKFKDHKKIQSKDSVAKAVQAGIIQGMTSNTFAPQGNATRAQAAVMLKRVLDKLGYL